MRSLLVAAAALAWVHAADFGRTAEVEPDEALRPVVLDLEPGARYGPEARAFQGIPGLERAPGGRLWATWYAGGEGEGEANYVVLATSGDDGRSWSGPVLVVDPPGPVRAYDPCLWIDPGGRLWLFWAQSYQWWDGRAGVWAATTDEPDAERPRWSAPRRLADGIMMNKPTVLADGSWLLPVAVWEREATADPAHRRTSALGTGAHAVASTDRGASWSLRGTALVPDRVFDEHMVVQRRDGSLWMLVRTAFGIGESTSEDGGATWGEGRRSGLRNVNSRFFLRRLRSGRLLLVAHEPPDGRTRSHLVARLSDDDGRTWSGPMAVDDRAGVSYPDGVEAPDGRIYLVYDYNRTKDKQILMATFTEADVAAGRAESPGARLRVEVDRATGRPGG